MRQRGCVMRHRSAVAAALLLCAAVWVWPWGGPVAQDAEVPVPERPMYGTAARDSDLVQADERMLQAAIDRGHTREKVFADAIRGGWMAYRAGELGLAMRRFNQAWLLNPENGNVFWGFAVTVEARDGDLERAAGFLARARTLLPDDPDLLVDSGRLMGRMGRIDESIDFFTQALALQPDVATADQGLAISYARKGDFRRALRHAERALERGETLPEPFMEELRTRAQ